MKGKKRNVIEYQKFIGVYSSGLGLMMVKNSLCRNLLILEIHLGSPKFFENVHG